MTTTDATQRANLTVDITGLTGRVICCLIAMAFFSIAVTAQAQTGPEMDTAEPAAVIEAAPGSPADVEIQQRIASIYSQIAALSNIDVSVTAGVVILSGEVSNERYATRAVDLANRLDGVIAVEDQLDRTLDVEGNVRPIVDEFRDDLNQWTRALPLVFLAVLLFLLVTFAGLRLANWSSLWRRLSPNPFLAGLIAQSIRVAAIVVGLILGLNLLGATALLGTILGGAGVLGLAIGFAVRDTLENYISSIMLSLRQPFRANDHVLINDQEGKVVRLTSRATVLMTLDGNHLRIPNSIVFKAVILNYSTNPERRFDFELGVDSQDDPIAAMKMGLDAIRKLPFVLREPAPSAVITAVGDSNIVIRFFGWVNQLETGFGKARSLAIRAAVVTLEGNGFTLPEPIYRLRFDTPLTDVLEQHKPDAKDQAQLTVRSTRPAATATSETVAKDTDMDVEPDTHIEKMVEEERAQESDTDLLDGSRPVE